MRSIMCARVRYVFARCWLPKSAAFPDSACSLHDASPTSCTTAPDLHQLTNPMTITEEVIHTAARTAYSLKIHNCLPGNGSRSR